MTDTPRLTGDLTFLPNRATAAARKTATKRQRPPMPVVTDADLLAPQRLPSLRGYWWKRDNWQVNGTGIFVTSFDPLTSDAQYLLETAFGFLHGTPTPDDPVACVEGFAREYGQRAAKSLRWRYGLPVSEAQITSVYRAFLFRHLMPSQAAQSRNDAVVLSIPEFLKFRAAREAAAREAERARLQAALTVDERGQIGMAL